MASREQRFGLPVRRRGAADPAGQDDASRAGRTVRHVAGGRGHPVDGRMSGRTGGHPARLTARTFMIQWERLENLSTFKIQNLYSTPAGVKFTLFQYGKLILAAAYTHLVETLEYGVEYKCDLPLNCYNTATAITGNNGSSGQFTLVNNVLTVQSTDSQLPLKNTFMGQLTTFLK